MENEIKETREHLWGSISNKIDKIETEADRLNWDQVIDMVAEAFSDASTTTDPLALFLSLYQFTFRLYHRLRSYSSPQPFNQITTTTVLENHNDTPYYRITNYDYKMFKWALAHHFTEHTTNDFILVPISKLSPSEKRHFEKRLDTSKH